MSRRSHKRRIVPWAVALLAALCLLWLTFKTVRVVQAYTAVREDLSLWTALADGAGPDLDASGLVRSLYSLHNNLERLQREAAPFLWVASRLQWLPRYGADLGALPVLLDTACTATAVAQQTATPLLPVLVQHETEPGSYAETTVDQLRALSEIRPQLQEDLASIQAGRTAYHGIAHDQLSPQVRGWSEPLGRALRAIEYGVVGGLVAPDLLAVDDSRTYLVLIQNEDELRATGGFISAVARVTVVPGIPVAVQFEDSYAVDDFSQSYPDPPEPLLEYMLSGLWLFRDSNWEPDFALSAQKAIELYAISRPGDIDGVIALDQQAIVALVEAIGPLSVPGIPKPVSGANVIQVSREAWNPGSNPADDWWAHRKDVMEDVLQAAVARFTQGIVREDAMALASALFRALEERHLLIHVLDERTADVLNQAHWDGGIVPAEQDYLMVVDTNMGFNKANALVEEHLEYTVDLRDLAAPRAVLTVHHQHTSEKPLDRCVHSPRYDETYEQMMERCYWDYVRVYAPPGTELLAASAHEVAAADLLSGRPSPGTVTHETAPFYRETFATLLLLRPGERLQTQLEWALPDHVLRHEEDDVVYELVAQKQPGTDAIPLRVQVLLPEGLAWEKSEPQPAAIGDTQVLWELDLETDRYLSVRLSPRPGPGIRLRPD